MRTPIWIISSANVCLDILKASIKLNIKRIINATQNPLETPRMSPLSGDILKLI